MATKVIFTKALLIWKIWYLATVLLLEVFSLSSVLQTIHWLTMFDSTSQLGVNNALEWCAPYRYAAFGADFPPPN